jgi:hypothetical protein
MTEQHRTLKRELEQWQDVDVAMYKLACVLGLMEYDNDLGTFRDNKHIFWTDNPTGNMLYKILRALHEAGFLESDTEGQKYRWKQSTIEF